MFQSLLNSLHDMKPIARPQYKILKNDSLNEQLISNGYIVLPMLDAEQVDFFKLLYKKWHPVDPVEFYKSYFNPNTEYKVEVEKYIMQHFTEKLEQYFVDYIPFGAMFVVKPTGNKGHIPPHQDWSFVDETKHWSLNTWCPLVDTQTENGTIQVLPGSHFFMESIRGSGTPELYDHLYDSIRPHLVNISLKAGEAIFFYHGTLHCSTYNINPEARVCLGLSLVQKNVPIYYNYLKSGEEKADTFLVDTDFYINYVSYRDQMPKTAKYLGKNSSDFSRLSKDNFETQLAEYSQQATHALI